MNKYDPERVYKRVDYVRYIYRLRNEYSAFESFMFPIVIYSRDGTIAAANSMFRDLTIITETDIQLGKINIFDYLDNSNAGLFKAAQNAFDENENVYINEKRRGAQRLLHAEAGSPEDYLLSKYPNAIFFPVFREGDVISLAGMLLDENKVNDAG